MNADLLQKKRIFTACKKIHLHFMEPEGLLSFLKYPVLWPNYGSDQSNPCHPILFSIYFNIFSN